MVIVRIGVQMAFRHKNKDSISNIVISPNSVVSIVIIVLCLW